MRGDVGRERGSEKLRMALRWCSWMSTEVLCLEQLGVGPPPTNICAPSLAPISVSPSG